MAEMIIFGAFIIIAFVSGTIIGQKLSKNEKIEVNPIKAINEYTEERQNKKEIKIENDKTETMLRNIDRYDGSGIGQEEIPY